jgi:hypothetical protein
MDTHNERQMDALDDRQEVARRRPQLWRPGQSGNPSGHTNMADRIIDLCAAFEATHGHPPSPLDMVGIRTAARLASASANPGINAEQAVRAGNTLHKTLKRLGLATPPAKRKREPMTVRDYAAAKNGAPR